MSLFSVWAGPLMVIVEYCCYGNLSTFLKSKREVFVQDQVSSTAPQLQQGLNWPGERWYRDGRVSHITTSSSTPEKQQHPLCVLHRITKLSHTNSHFCNALEVGRCYHFSTFTSVFCFTGLDVAEKQWPQRNTLDELPPHTSQQIYQNYCSTHLSSHIDVFIKFDWDHFSPC